MFRIMSGCVHMKMSLVVWFLNKYGIIGWDLQNDLIILYFTNIIILSLLKWVTVKPSFCLNKKNSNNKMLTFKNKNRNSKKLKHLLKIIVTHFNHLTMMIQMKVIKQTKNKKRNKRQKWKWIKMKTERKKTRKKRKKKREKLKKVKNNIKNRKLKKFLKKLDLNIKQLMIIKKNK